MNLNTQILIAAILGLAFGFLLTMYPDTAFVKHSLYGLGILSSVFIGLLKMLLVPLILAPLWLEFQICRQVDNYTSLENHILVLYHHHHLYFNFRY